MKIREQLEYMLDACSSVLHKIKRYIRSWFVDQRDKNQLVRIYAPYFEDALRRFGDGQYCDAYTSLWLAKEIAHDKELDQCIYMNVDGFDQAMSIYSTESAKAKFEREMEKAREKDVEIE